MALIVSDIPYNFANLIVSACNLILYKTIVLNIKLVYKHNIVKEYELQVESLQRSQERLLQKKCITFHIVR
jgi:hypothetical protein